MTFVSLTASWFVVLFALVIVAHVFRGSGNMDLLSTAFVMLAFSVVFGLASLLALPVLDVCGG